jgi:aminoglycoside phosphotransferase (APT) family kinase protein
VIAARPTPSLWEFVEESGLDAVVLGASKDPNAKVTVLLVSPESRRPAFAVKVPTTDAAADAVAAEAGFLSALRRDHPAPADAVPRVIGTVEYGGRTGMVTDAMRGTPMTTSYLRPGHTADPDRVRADFAAVDRWLTGFQEQTARGAGPLDIADGAGDRLAERFPGDPRLASALDNLYEVRSRLGGCVAPLTAVHGDLWCGNVLTEDGAVSGVVDWEAGELSGDPVRDLVRFALMYALFLDRRTRPGRRVRGHPGLRRGLWGSAVDYAVDGAGWFPSLFSGFLRRGLVRLGVSPAHWRDVVLAGLAEVAAVTDDPDFASSNLDVFLRLSSRRPCPRRGPNLRIGEVEEVSGGPGALI